MSARRWPGSSRDATRPTSEPVVLAPASVLTDWTLEEAKEEERKLEDGVRTARRERDDAEAALATAKASLPEAASRGFEAVREAQRTISDAEERLRAAQYVWSAMDAALRPVAEERYRLVKIRNREKAAAALAEKIVQRAAVDADLVAALDAVALLAARRDTVTAEASGIIETVKGDGGGPIGVIEPTYYGSPVRDAVARLPLSLRRAVAT